ncbi:MAG: hypothetical protein ABSG98_00295 [Anaerolineales bacterium]|jgi:hypothetical protein
MKTSRRVDWIFVPAATAAVLLLGWCCTASGQQATLVAASVNATLTAQPPQGLPAAPTVPAGPTAAATFLSTPQAAAGGNQAQGSSVQGYAVATEAINWKRTKYDPLTTNLFGWCENSKPIVGSDGGTSRFFFNQGVYEVSYTTGDTGASRWCAPYGTYYDFSASIKTLLLDADSSGYYGLVFRVYQQSYSSLIGFWLSPSGQYYVGAFDEHGNYVSLQDLTDASGLLPNGQWNKLTVDAEGSVFTFFVNDVFQTQLTYNSGSAAHGSIGVSVGVNSPHRSIDVQFSDYEVREP